MASAECFQRRGGVHICDRHNLLLAVGIRIGAADFAELFPAVLNLVDVRHVGHRAACGQVRQCHGLFGRGQDIGGFSHEMHAAEYDVVGIGTFGGVLGELEGITHKVSVHDDFVTLVEVTKDEQLIAETRLGGLDTFLQFLIGSVTVFLRQHLLAGCVVRQRVEHGCARAVARLGGVEMPRILCQSGIACALRAQSGDDFVYG